MLDNTFYRYERGSRFYQFWIQYDLLGDLTVVVVNGSIDAPLGAINTKLATGIDDARNKLTALKKQRERANYSLRIQR